MSKFYPIKENESTDFDRETLKTNKAIKIVKNDNFIQSSYVKKPKS